MVSNNQTEKKITGEQDLEVSDIFEINNYEYYIITDVTSKKVNGVIRDGIYTVGHSKEQEFDKSTIMSRINNGWNYIGVFTYRGEDINGDPIDKKEN